MSSLFDFAPAIMALDSMLSLQSPVVDTLTTSIIPRQFQADRLRSTLSDIDASISAVPLLEEKIFDSSKNIRDVESEHSAIAQSNLGASERTPWDDFWHGSGGPDQPVEKWH